MKARSRPILILRGRGASEGCISSPIGCAYSWFHLTTLCDFESKITVKNDSRQPRSPSVASLNAIQIRGRMSLYRRFSKGSARMGGFVRNHNSNGMVRSAIAVVAERLRASPSPKGFLPLGRWRRGRGVKPLPVLRLRCPR